jgi:hypothetical protein
MTHPTDDHDDYADAELEARAAALGIELHRKPVWRRALSRLLGSPKSS